MVRVLSEGERIAKNNARKMNMGNVTQRCVYVRNTDEFGNGFSEHISNAVDEF